MNLVVLDGNAYWTEQLFTNCPAFDKVLLLKPRDVRAHRSRHDTLFGDGTPRRVRDGIWEQRLSMVPGWLDGAWPLARWWLARAIRDFIGNEPYALVLCFPQYRTLLDVLTPDLSIYYNYDDYRDNWPHREATLTAAEDDLVARCDVTLCIAHHRTQILSGRVPAQADHIYHMPIGCTPDFLADHPSPPKPSPPSVLAPHLDNDRPVAGYVGTLGSRFHHAFLADVAEQRPDVTFILGGPEPTETDEEDAEWCASYRRLKRMKHVHFIGWVPHDQLGTYLLCFDMLLMPYAPCRFNRNACPAKLWDYLGTTRPIIANDVVPEVNMWDDVVHVTNSPSTFAAVMDEVRHEPQSVAARRLQIAKDHTYAALGRRTSNLLRPYLFDHALS